MKHFTEFNSQMSKLEGLLAEHKLIPVFKANSYPMTLTIVQDQSPEAQMELYETSSSEVSSADAKLVLTFPIAEIGVRVYGRFIIADSLMNKIKAHGKKLRDLYLQCEYAQRMENADSIGGDSLDTEYSEETECDDSIDDEFAEFFEDDDTEGNGEE